MKITKQYLVKVIKEELEATLEGELPEDPGLPQERTGPDGPSDVGKGYNNRRTEWRLNGKLHRKDGPAVVHADGHEEYWIDGKKVKPFKTKNNKYKNTMAT